MIELKDVQAGYGSKNILHGITAFAKSGQFVALLGPNGSGKSTLLKTLSGIITPTGGEVSLDNVNVGALSAKQRACQMAYLAQGREVARGLRVSDILEIGRAPHRGRLGKISADGRAAIESAADRTQITDFINRLFESLSGGEQARVLLARALVVQAPILLADEPIAALDPFYQISTMETLKAEANSGKLVIAALHDLALAHQYADQVWVLHEGKVVISGPPSEALSAETLRTVFGIKPPQYGFQMMQRIE